MMQPLTLTGATVLSDQDRPQPLASNSNSSNNSAAAAPLSTLPADHAAALDAVVRAYQATAQPAGNAHSHSHHGHTHHHSNNSSTASAAQQPCCGAPINTVPLRPQIRMNVSSKELVQSSTPAQLYQTVHNLIRIGGTLDMVQDIIQAWQQHAGEVFVREQLQQPDAAGHSLLHWATKRVEDVRFVSYLVSPAVGLPPDLISQDATGMTPMHWACTVSETDVVAATNNRAGRSSSSSSVHHRHPALPMIRALLQADAARAAGGGSRSHGTPPNVTISLLENTDAAGCTPLILAAQHGQVELAAYLLQHGANLYATDQNLDTAVHWAAYKGSETVLGLLQYYELHRRPGGNNHSPLLLQPDGYGQMPLHLAALRGHTAVCRYILQQIAVWSTEDGKLTTGATTGGSSRASATAASAAAAAAATTTALAYVLQYRDKNGRTPYALAVHKQKPTVAALLQGKVEQIQMQLQQQQAAARWYAAHGNTSNNSALRGNKRGSNASIVSTWMVRLIQPLCIAWSCRSQQQQGWMWTRCKQAGRNLVSIHAWKVWLGLPEVDDVDESPAFPYYYVWTHFGLHVWFVLTYFVNLFGSSTLGAVSMADYAGTLVVLAVLWCLGAYAFIQVGTTNPGRLDASDPHIAYWRRLYEETLESYAQDDDDNDDDKNDHQEGGLNNNHSNVPKSKKRDLPDLQLCHTCHIARPPRSKHDRFSRVCIKMFDHHCPFVGTSIGQNNYQYFLAFLLVMTVYLCVFGTVFMVYGRRCLGAATATPWSALLLGIFLLVHVLFPAGMLLYHSQLVLMNLTTNEHANLHRYDHFWITTTTTEATGTNSGGSSSSTLPQAQTRRFVNPWDKGGWWGNIYDRLVAPSDGSFGISLSSVNRTASTMEQQQMVGLLSTPSASPTTTATASGRRPLHVMNDDSDNHNVV